VHPVARISSNVNEPPYATVFLVLVFIVHLHNMFRPLIGGHLQVICDKIYSKVATVYVNGSVEMTCLRQVPWLCKFIQYIKKTPWSESARELYRPSDGRLSAK
jgi:hypothetical protein